MEQGWSEVTLGQRGLGPLASNWCGHGTGAYPGQRSAQGPLGKVSLPIRHVCEEKSFFFTGSHCVTWNGCRPLCRREDISHTARMAESTDRRQLHPWKYHQISDLINPGNAILFMWNSKFPFFKQLLVMSSLTNTLRIWNHLGFFCKHFCVCLHPFWSRDSYFMIRFCFIFCILICLFCNISSLKESTRWELSWCLHNPGKPLGLWI